jgi:hypothetical protein
MSGVILICCVKRLHGKSFVKRELLTKQFGMVAMGETFVKVNRDLPSEIIHDSGGEPEDTGNTPMNMPVLLARMVTA